MNSGPDDPRHEESSLIAPSSILFLYHVTACWNAANCFVFVLIAIDKEKSANANATPLLSKHLTHSTASQSCP